MKTTDLDTFTRAYIECALWSSMDNLDEKTGGDPLDANYSADDISEETLQRMIADCAQFQESESESLHEVSDICDESRAGQNFWLNRNRHGSGFWDEYFGNNAPLRAAFRNLSDASKAWGSFDLYVGDDGKIYA